MNPEPEIKTLSEKKLLGMRMTMTIANNKTSLLWQSFMTRRKEITNNSTNELISMQVYHEPIRIGDLNQVFDKWAAVKVPDFDTVPENMEPFTLKAGLYAVFPYKGLSTDNSIFIFIFGTWLPNSKYLLDDRPHFEILGEKYKNGDPESEEEIWIPIKHK